MKYGLKRVKNRHQDALARVSWERMESLLAVYYAAHGYTVEHVGTGKSGTRFDGGIDLKLRRDDEYVLVQVKHWNAYKVPHNDVNQLMGLRWNEGATGAILITSGEFTHAAIEAAKRQGNVELIDGVQLREMIGPFAEFSDGVAAPAPEPDATQALAFKPTRGKAAEIPFGVRAFIAVAGLVFFLFVIRTVVGRMTHTFNEMSRQNIERAEASAARAQQPAEAPKKPFAQNTPSAPAPGGAQATPQQFQRWEVTPVGPQAAPSDSPKTESAADKKAREAFLNSVPEV